MKTLQHCAPDLKACGCTDEHLEQLRALPAGVDWSTLLQLVQQYGPQIITLLLALFGKSPLPNPLPPLKS